MKVDFHVHCSDRSACGRSSADEQVEAAIHAGLDAIAFTDHERMAPPVELVRLNAKFAPFKVMGGIELGINGEHVLVLGVHDPALETRKWDYLSLHAFVASKRGVLAVAHPFRRRPSVELPLRDYPPDAIEISSINIVPESVDRIRSLAESLGIPVLSNSDAHATDSIGRHYNVFRDDMQGEMGILDALRRGAFNPVALEQKMQTEEQYGLG